jgi:hypothetical protein
MNNRIKMTDSKFKRNIFLFLSVTVFMARLSTYKPFSWINITVKNPDQNLWDSYKQRETKRKAKMF